MKPKRLHDFVAYFLTSVAVLTALGALVGLAAIFAPDRFSGLSPAGKWGSLLALAVLAALLAWFGRRYGRALGLERGDAAPAAPPSYDFSAPGHRTNRANVMSAVRAGYIEGVLRRSMPEQVRLNLGLDPAPDALLRPRILWEGEPITRSPATSEEIHQLFTTGGRALLILGAPGSGKTITLLELCEVLLLDAEHDPEEPVPVVINLSTWAEARKPLAEWIADEMLRQYGLALRVTAAWLAAGHLALLLDGLDEVRAEARDACVAAINDFRAAHSAPLVVCSRAADYESLRERLNLINAVLIQPLDEGQVAAYLADPRLDLGAVAAAVAEDDVLRQLAAMPLMLNIMAVAYQGAAADDLRSPAEDAVGRRANLYDAYIRRVLRRRPPRDAGYGAAESLRRLRYLAGQLAARSQTQFFIENLQFAWLTPRQQRVARLVLLLLFGVVGGVVGGVVFEVVVGVVFEVVVGVVGGAVVGVAGRVLGGDVGSVVFGVVGGVVGGVVFGVMEGVQMGIAPIEPVDELYFIRPNLRSVGAAVKDILPIGVVFGVVFGVLGAVLGGVLFGVLFGVLGGVLFGVLFGVLGGVLFGVQGHIRPIESRRRMQPNQGIHRSAVNALRVGVLVAVLIAVLSTVVSVVVSAVVRAILIAGIGASLVYLMDLYQDWLMVLCVGIGLAVVLGIVLGIVLTIILAIVLFGLLFGLVYIVVHVVLGYGGDAVIRHYTLRLLLAHYGYLPARIVPFLDAMAARVLVQRAGAHYRFIHRTFQEHVAALTDEAIARLAGEEEAARPGVREG